MKQLPQVRRTEDGAVLEVPLPCRPGDPLPAPRDAQRALQRGAYRTSALALRKLTGHIGAAIELERMANALCSYPIEDDGETTVVTVMPERLAATSRSR
jgi:hypothetical protein